MSTTKPALPSNSVWALGHALFLISSLLYFSSSIAFFYKLGFLGLCASFMVDVYRATTTSTTTATTNTVSLVEKVFLSDKTPYLFLSIILYILPPTSVYNVIQAGSNHHFISQTPWWKQYGRSISDQLQAVHPQALDLAAQMELLALPWLLLSIFSNGLVLPLVYASFLRWQYFVNSRTRTTVAVWDDFLSKSVEHPSCPKQLRKIYNTFKGIMKRWARFANAPSSQPTTTTTRPSGSSRRQ